MIFAPHGLIVPTDSVERMTDALCAMEEDPERRRGYGEKAAIRARAFSAKAAKDRYWEVVRAALAER
jgi:glycosyltransferase involved in cell wall biosynthesis